MEGTTRPVSPEIVVAPEVDDDSSSRPTTPLDPEANGVAWATGVSPGRRRWRVTSTRGVLLLATWVKFSVTLSGMMLLLPTFRLLEDIFCRRHLGYTGPDMIEESKCKGPEVQEDLAYLLGWLMLVMAIVGVVIALPYGALADRIGRKPVIILTYSNLAFGSMTMPFTFPYLRNINPYWMLVGCLFQAIGGGIPVMFTTIYSMVADVTDEKNRGSSFLMLMVGVTIAGLIGPVISGVLMETFGVWMPIYVVSAITPFVIGSMFLFPETLKRKPEDPREPSQSFAKWVRSQIFESLVQGRAATSVLKTRSVALVLATFLIHNPINTAHSITLVQYVSQQFGWAIAQTSFLLSPLGVLSVAVLAGLPKVSEVLTSPAGRFKLTPFRKDAVLARFSLGCIVIACLIEGLSRTISPFIFGLVIGTFGAAVSPLSRALLTHYVEPKFTSRLMALISIVETMGNFLGGPLIAAVFHLGQKKGGILTGLPFLYVGALAAVAFILMMYIRKPVRDEDDEEAVDLRDPYVDDSRREAAYSDEPDAPLL
ncbi:uncharacterized protein DNG_08804 [Cephalotrichum gorgonifer]|uniref:Major facilitator superfamily (MFS) profile domain-containing protein n=1 Tax=Cephalotrichum gorgonifer TaxID=2041049 RepID=A0AAE8N7C8_9PEZI|nr:uncharacterized protein DNG_08804 [Cephalotrichum gorgonifer]